MWCRSHMGKYMAERQRCRYHHRSSLARLSIEKDWGYGDAPCCYRWHKWFLLCRCSNRTDTDNTSWWRNRRTSQLHIDHNIIALKCCSKDGWRGIIWFCDACSSTSFWWRSMIHLLCNQWPLCWQYKKNWNLTKRDQFRWWRSAYHRKDCQGWCLVGSLFGDLVGYRW